MDVNTISNNSLDIQSILLSESNKITRSNNNENQTANYAQKGEPMYMEDMDTDKDGTITLDEYRSYCKSKGIGVREMVKMSKLAASYRTMKAEGDAINNISKLIPNIQPNLKHTDSISPANHKNSETKFRTENNNISYKEYISFCEQNKSSDEPKAYATAEKDDDGTLKLTNTGKAIKSYIKNNTQTSNGMYEAVV